MGRGGAQRCARGDGPVAALPARGVALVFALSIAIAVSPSAAGAAPIVELPTRASWAVIAPRPDRLAQATRPLLENASRNSYRLRPATVERDLRKLTGLSLLNASALKSAGVDVRREWTLFELEGKVYLSVGVANRRRLTRALDAWAKARFLRFREEKAIGGAGAKKKDAGLVVVFSRSEGARPAMGYAVSGDRAVVLLDHRGSIRDIESALASVESAAPVRPSADAPLLLHFDAPPWARDVWLGLTPRADGIDASGTLRTSREDLLTATPAHRAWVEAPVKAGAARDAPPPMAWFRVLAGNGSGRGLAALVSNVLGIRIDDAQLTALTATAPGKWEVVTPRLALDAVQPPPEGLGPVAGLDFLTPLTVRLADRTAKADAQVLNGVARSLPGAQRIDGRTVVSHARGRPVTVAMADGLVLSNALNPTPSPATPGGAPLLSCRAGFPVAAIRLEPSVLAQQLGGVGLFSSMGNPALLSLFAIGNEYGAMLRASSTMAGLLCREKSGRVRFEAGWRIPTT